MTTHQEIRFLSMFLTHFRIKLALFLVLFILCIHTEARAAIDVNKSFSPATIYPRQVSRLTIKLFNSTLMPSTDTAFTDVFPDNVFVTATPNLVSNCGGTTTYNNTSSRGSVTLVDGVIPASDGTNLGACEITLDVTSSVKGTYINEIFAGDVESVSNGFPVSNTQSSQGTLAVILQNLTGSMSLDIGNSYLQGYETTMRRITLNNPNPVALTGVTFDYDMYTYGYNIRAIDGGAFTTTCGGVADITERPARVSTLGTTSFLAFSGGTILANSSCEIAFEVEPSRSPTRYYYNRSINHKLPINAVTTNEGATNITEISGYVYTRTGIRVDKRFNNSQSSTINLNDTNTASLRIIITNYNVEDLVNISLDDIMPTLSPSSGEMVVNSIDSNTCGGVTSNNTTSLSLSAGKVSGGAPGQSGLQSGSCEIQATVSINAAGSYVNEIPEGVLAGHEYYTPYARATLTVSDRLLEVSKSFSRNAYQGDTTILTFSLSNYSSSSPVSNIDINDDLSAMSGFRVDSAGIVSNTCGGSSTVTPDTTLIQLQDLSLLPQQQCEISVKIRAAADAYPVGWKTNSVPIGNITFDTPSATGNIYGLIPSARIYLYSAFRLYKYWSPEVTGPLGLSRLRISVRHYSYDRNGASGIEFTDTLPTGHVIAEVPNVLNGCGGTVIAEAGTNTISLSNASLPPASATLSECSIYVDVRAPAMTPPNTTEISYNVINGDGHGDSDPHFSAIDDSQPAPYNRHENYYSASAGLTRIATGVTMNKEFLPVSINGVARVRIEFSNISSTAIDLTGVGITDSFTDTDMRLYSTVDATFTDASGNPNSNGCEGGTFSGNPGDTSISLSEAIINKGSFCVFEFNVTAYRGGNHINTLSAGDMTSSEGVTNHSDGWPAS